jgi:uncharacterized protein (TIGR00661 family)
MKILYATQGTGNGHLSRARDIIPALQRRGEVDVLVSGTQSEIQLDVAIKYRFKGLGFVFGKGGGVDLWRTFLESDLKCFVAEMNSLPIRAYDLIINDFEPVSAWAAHFHGKACISLSHQSALLSDGVPLPKHKDWLGRLILRHYAPSTFRYGFHFEVYNKNVFTPVIRNEVRQLEISNQGHYTVYLPAYEDEKLLSAFLNFKEVQWQVFSKHGKQSRTIGNVQILPVQNEAFIQSMASSAGVLCGAGFETPAEALFLGKKLMVIPMKYQYEQYCNAAALKKMRVPVIKSLKKKNWPALMHWLRKGTVTRINFPDMTTQLVDSIILAHGATRPSLVSQAFNEEPNTALLGPHSHTAFAKE